MRYNEASSKIDADPKTIWEILINAKELVEGDIGVTRLEGDIRLGNKIKLWAEVGGDRAFPIKVIEMNHQRKMVWQGGMPFGLFKGTRVFNLTPDNEATIFNLREDYTGPLVPLIWKSMPDMAPSFETFVSGIKRLAEAKSK
ncbi:MAG: hypothetical protein ABJE63_09895 [Lentilitoribacter sp.]